MHRLVLDGRVRVLVTVRTGESAPDAVVALWKEDLVPRLELELLSLAETESLLTAVVGGRIESATLTRLTAAR